MRVGVATIVAGRRDHLRRQAAAVTVDPRVARHVVVAMDRDPVAVDAAQVIRIAPDAGGLPLAAARNRALEALGDCDLAVMLDVDCIPGDDLVTRYVAAAQTLQRTPSLLCGPVGYLDPLPDTSPSPGPMQRHRAQARVIRDFPDVGVRGEPRAELFWSLSFAVTPQTHRAIGGFDEGYVGYGAEDTDYGLAARAAGVSLWFVGGAWAYHQAHPPSAAPAQLVNIVANARRFHARWGFWPMPDRLGEFVAAGLIRWTPEGVRCELPA